jgi:antitoxin ParD1/3/4
MTTMNVSLPDDLKVFVDEQVATGGYGTTSEYIRELIREARKHAARQRLEALLLEGLNSGPATPMTDEWWAERRRELERRVQQQQAER